MTTHLLAILGLVVSGGLVTWIFISDGVRDVAFSLTGRLMPLYLENEIGLALLQIGALQSITAVVAMIFMTPAGWLSDKMGERVGIVGPNGVGKSTFLHMLTQEIRPDSGKGVVGGQTVFGF